ncbi:hypothetical protein KDW_46670 [Dictyobacter vulcani]|uniref:Uncharacterized protein n=1 Tax=Dictyobacter vulcani TaxID=2607529 RepID=A0A5J4KRI4_9CHLR|nr:hypothetical protein KDW_46670 [Dictyobacter vulcani]
MCVYVRNLTVQLKNIYLSRDSGIHFHRVISDLSLNAPQITSNGATVIAMSTNTLLQQQLIPPHYILPVVEYPCSLDLQFCYYSHDYLYAEQALYDRYNWFHSGIPVHSVENIEDVSWRQDDKYCVTIKKSLKRCKN